MEDLAGLKLGLVTIEANFNQTITKNLIPYFESLIPFLNTRRKIILPRGKHWEQEDARLYSRMREAL